MDVARRLKVGLAACIALLGATFFAAPALAATQPDPTETNVPYLAWRGEQVRLVKCAPAITGVAQRADFLLVDWSGEENSLAIPQMEGGTAGFLVATGRDHLGQGCVAATFSSQKAGLAQIKLVVSSLPGGIGGPYTTPGGVGFLPGGNVVGLAGNPILKHDFLVGWMNLNPPVLSVGNPPGPLGAPPAGGFPTPGADVLSDVAGAGPNNFRVDVTGNIPLRADFRELGLGDTLQMPADWPRLATAIGTFFNPDNPVPGPLWDIHDDRTTAEAHGAQSVCPTVATGTAGAAERAANFDAVDNCPQTLVGGGLVGFLNATTRDVISTTFPGIGGGGADITVPVGTGPYAISNCNLQVVPAVTSACEFGSFSRIWRGPTFATIGPFDPLKPSETLLSNGQLNAEDAPMPAARIDFTTSGGGFFGCVGTTPVAGPGGAGCNAGTTGPNGWIGSSISATGVITTSLFPTLAACLAGGFTTCVPLGPALLPNQLAKDKHVIYSRTGTGAPTAAAPNQHNLYAPFYGRFIPATARASQFACTAPGTPVGCDPRLPANFTPNAEASGEDGPSGSVLDNTAPAPSGCTAGSGTACPNIGTNNFNGWLVNGLYHYWDVARVLSNAATAPSSCLLRFVTSITPTSTPSVLRVPVARPLTSGPQTVAVYTDEHGEAHVNWFPGIGFSFAGLSSNLNLGCELQNVSPLAQPVIQAVARYPFEPVTAPPLLSNTFTKTVTSLFNKQVRCAPKGTSVNDQFSQICVFSATDITGSPVPFAGEIVCFASNAELIQHFHNELSTGLPELPASLGGGRVAGTLLSPAELAALGKAGAAIQCQRLDAGGRAAVELFGKGASNVLVDVLDEGLIRAITFNFGPPSSATGTSEAPAVTSTAAPTAQQIAAVNAASTNGTTQVVQSNGQKTSGTAPAITPGKVVPGTKPAVRFRVVRADVMTPVNGKSYLVVRVNGPKGNVKVRIRLVGARTTIKTIDRKIPTNKVVKIKNIKISAAVRSVRVSVVS